ncbi:hypothetical protein SUNI508_04017 [Seiridium unicorne]|uniref:Uncharacterized protein n=1 Tax=Seiridium unicorne TaxID=138068 RepID=A0ABR2VAH9_9PEZI
MLFQLQLVALLPAALIQTSWAATVTVVRTITETAIVEPSTTQSLPPPPPPPPTTLSTSFTYKCDEMFCSQGSQWCFYWGGVSSYDITRGPVPGETHTILGQCTNVTTTVPESVVTQTLTSKGMIATETTTIPARVTVVEQWR